MFKSCSYGFVRSLVATLGAALVLCAGAGAAELRIGFKAEVSSADPHVLNGQNRNVWMHVYESLVGQDDKLRSFPQLAVSWKALDDVTWEFKLRPGVAFHDGAAFSAEDVKYSIERAMSLTGARTFRSYLNAVENVRAVDPLTVHVRTKGRAPTLPDNLGLIAILPKSLGSVNEEAFEGGKAAIGTGPYRLSEWQRGQRVVLAKFDRYWGGKEPWDKVTFQFIPKEPARASALLAGSVDLIDGASAGLADAFERSNRVQVVGVTSYMTNYVQLDRFRASSPFVTGNDGQPLSKNPLDDRRVRQAMHLAINREAIQKHVMKGDSEPASQLVPPGFFGYDTTIKVPPSDAVRAKALLSEAGYGDGFRIAFHCSNDRYLNDSRVCEAIGQMLTQVGIKVDVRTLPFAVFQTRSMSGGANGEPEFSMFMTGIGAVTGESLEPLTAIVHTYDRAQGLGANNRGRYTNKELDALIDQARRTLDPTRRDATRRSGRPRRWWLTTWR